MNETSTDTQTIAATTEPEWADDGHHIRVTLDQSQFEFTVICPFDATDLTGRAWADLPVCRRARDEYGNPRPDKSPTANCGLAIFGEEWTADEFFDAGPDVPVFEVVSPFPVVYRFAGWDGDEVYVRPKQIATAADPAAGNLEQLPEYTHLAEIRQRDETLYGSRSARDLVHQDRHQLLHMLDAAVRDRDLAAAHDRQPYPTAWAYEQACKARDAAKSRARVLEQRHDAIWDVILELRQKATARGLDPYQDPAAQTLSAILTGDGGWQITYGSLVEARDDLDAAKTRGLDLWNRTKFEAEEFDTEWQPDVARGEGALALVGIEEDGAGFFTGVTLRPLVPGQGAPAATEPATAACPSCDGIGQEMDTDGASQGECLRCYGSGTAVPTRSAT